MNVLRALTFVFHILAFWRIFHTSRHTFASEVCLLNGVPIETISRLLGHTNVKTTMVYAKISDTAINRDMATLSRKLNQMEVFEINTERL